jgi:hypothetical protein
MTSDSEGQPAKGQHGKSRAKAPVIDLEATDLTPPAGPDASDASPGETTPEPVVPDVGETVAPAEAAATAGPVSEPAPEPSATSDTAPPPPPSDGDTSALLSEVPPSGESSHATGAAADSPRLSTLFAAAAISTVVTLAATFGSLYAAGVLGSAAPDATATEVDDLAVEVRDLGTRLNALPVVDVARIDKRLAALEAGRSASPDGAAASADIDALKSSLAALEARVAAVPAAGPGNGEDLAAIRSEMATLAGRLDRLDRTVGDLSGTGEAVAALEKSTDERVGALEKRLDAGPKGGEIATLSLAVTSLAGKIDAGLPFAADYKLAAAAAPDLAGLEKLAPYADKGVPTFDALIAGLPAEAMLARRPVDPSASWYDNVVAAARSVINYRETGPAAEDPASRAIEAMRAALKAGDSAAAVKAADALPEWARAGAGDWLARLDARAAADAALTDLTAHLVDRLKAPAEGR